MSILQERRLKRMMYGGRRVEEEKIKTRGNNQNCER
jgi:hypothetical protein